MFPRTQPTPKPRRNYDRPVNIRHGIQPYQFVSEALREMGIRQITDGPVLSVDDVFWG